MYCSKPLNCLVITLCMLTPLLCAAQPAAESDEVSYLSFAVPGALGTYPMSINASSEVTGYYNLHSISNGFLRAADGTITTFSVHDAIQTIPESINDAGQITGFYEAIAGDPHGFLREPDGQIITFDPDCGFEYFSFCANSIPVSINAFGVIVGNHPVLPLNSSGGFTRSRAGVLTTTQFSGEMHGYPTFFSSVNASGATVGSFFYLDFRRQTSDTASFMVQPSGYSIQFSVPVNPDYTSETTVAEAINDDGVIAGWYSVCFYDCADITSGGFVRTPGGLFTVFNPPGPIVTAPEAPSIFFAGQPLTEPHRLSINGDGAITGSYTDTYGYSHGFVRNPYGTITTFDPPRGLQTTATSINDGGVITGSYYFFWNDQAAQGFLRLPKP